MNKIIIELKYEEVNFKWITNHYDVHLNGTCIYNNELCEFINKYPENEENIMVKIYKLSIFEKIKWIFKQKIFEIMVGYHWTYSKRKKCINFYYRKPKFLFKFLFELYYKIQNIKNE